MGCMETYVSKRYNYGIALLKIIMSFEVVVNHFYEKGKETILGKPFSIICTWAIPVFMIISFYYLEKSNCFIDNKMIQKRMKRLLYPQVGWSIIIWCILNIEAVFGFSEKQDVRALIWQLFTGHRYNAPMWFLVTLIVLTCFYILMNRVLKSFALPIMIVTAAIAVVLQYNGFNYFLFHELRVELTYLLGRMAECVPFAVIGIVLGKYEVLENLLHRWVIVMVVSSAVILAVEFGVYKKMLLRPDGFGYSGIPLLILSTLSVILFFVMPLKVEGKISKYIISISKITFGIYCIHVTVGNLLCKMIPIEVLAISSLEVCIMIWIVSFGVAWVLSKSEMLKRLVL